MFNLDKYAVIKTGGKQYLVSEGQELDVEKLAKKKGAKVSFNEVLFIKSKKVKIGKPFVKGV